MTSEQFKQESPYIRYSIWTKDTDFLQVYDEYKNEFIGKKYKYHAYAFMYCDKLNREYRDGE